MEKTLREFLEEKKTNKKERKEYCLNDYFKKDPNQYCPDCFGKVRVLHTHNLEGLDFECYDCKLNYTLWLYAEGGF
jgi:hypothetical protein